MTFVRPFCAASCSISARLHAKPRLTWTTPGEENVAAELETRPHDFCTDRIGCKRKNHAATAACRALADPTHRHNVTCPVQDDVARPAFFSSVHTITLYTTCTTCLRDQKTPGVGGRGVTNASQKMRNGCQTLLDRKSSAEMSRDAGALFIFSTDSFRRRQPRRRAN